MNIVPMTPEVLVLVAARFKALSEPVRLQILTTLWKGELTVGQLVEQTELGQANVSRHLQVLYNLGFARRRRDGPFVYCGLADQSVFQLCAITCGQLATESKVRRKVLAG